jgi:hypothetical protein
MGKNAVIGRIEARGGDPPVRNSFLQRPRDEPYRPRRERIMVFNDHPEQSGFHANPAFQASFRAGIRANYTGIGFLPFPASRYGKFDL